MPEIIGTVRCVQTGDDFAFTTIVENDTGDQETLIVWMVPSTIPADAPVRTRIMLGHWLAMLRQAMSDGLTVTVTHPSDSAEITAVRLNA